MATIKSHSDLQQSKKLAEILPLESADMYYIGKPDSTNSNMIPSDICIPKKTYIDGQAYGELCAWSLAALMNYLKEVDYFPKIQANEYEITMSIDYQDKDEDEIYTINIYAESFVDACVAMIEKLNKLKLL